MSLQQPLVLFAGNDQTISFGPLILGSSRFFPSPTYILDGVGTFTTSDPSGVAVPGATNLSFSFVAGSNGLYTVTIFGSAFNPTLLSQSYSTLISFTSAAQSASNKWTIPTTVKLRNSS